MDHAIPILLFLPIVVIVASMSLLILKIDNRLSFGWRRLAEIVAVLMGAGALSFWAALRYGTWE